MCFIYVAQNKKLLSDFSQRKRATCSGWESGCSGEAQWGVRRAENGGLYLQITAQHLQGVVYAVYMAALITVTGVDAGTDETVADVKACT